jgi:hypothetical protein
MENLETSKAESYTRGLIKLWLYKEEKTSYGIEKKIYLLYIFPP